MGKSFLEEYIESERFAKFLEKQKVEISFEENRLSIYVKENINDTYSDSFVNYYFSIHSDTFINPVVYQFEGLNQVPKEIEYPDELRAIIKTISKSIK